LAITLLLILPLTQLEAALRNHTLRILAPDIGIQGVENAVLSVALKDLGDIDVSILTLADFLILVQTLRLLTRSTFT